jgi:hypothetical protein
MIPVLGPHSKLPISIFNIPHDFNDFLMEGIMMNYVDTESNPCT